MNGIWADFTIFYIPLLRPVRQAKPSFLSQNMNPKHSEISSPNTFPLKVNIEIMVRQLTIYVCDHCPQVYSDERKCQLHEQLMHQAPPPVVANAADDTPIPTAQSPPLLIVNGVVEQDAPEPSPAVLDPMSIFNVGLGESASSLADGSAMTVSNVPSSSPQINGRLMSDLDVLRKQHIVECEVCGVAPQGNFMFVYLHHVFLHERDVQVPSHENAHVGALHVSQVPDDIPLAVDRRASRIDRTLGGEPQEAGRRFGICGFCAFA